MGYGLGRAQGIMLDGRPAVLRGVAMATTLASYIWGAHWRHLANTTEPSMCGGDVALCKITLTTCYHYYCTATFTVIVDVTVVYIM